VSVDRDVTRLVEGSAIVRAIERVVIALTAAVEHSRLLPAMASPWAAARTRPGTVMLAACATHVVLMLVMARPVAGYWLILPSIDAVAGVLLLVMVDARAGRG
jgi:hypothetical protein